MEAIRTLPAAAGAGQPGNQVAWSLLTNTLPSRILHLLRTHPVGLTAEFCEELQAMLQEAVLSIMDVPSLTAVQWEMAFVPPPEGGLGLQHLPTARVVARASALVAACQHFPASEVPLEKVAAEREELIDRLLLLMCQHPAEILGDIRSPPPQRSAAKVSRKLWRSIHSQKRRQLHTEVARVGDIHMLENWKLAVGDLEAPGALNARDAWMIPNELLDQLALPKLCGTLLDAQGAHAGHCCRSMRMQRHNALRNFLAHHARCSGAAVHVEQKTTQDVLAELGVTAEDGTRARRPLHTADVHIFDTQARQVWLDVRVTVPPSAAA